MYFQYLLFNVFIVIASSFVQFADSNSFVPVGCYRDLQVVPRPLPELLHNYRLNNEMDWLDLNTTVVEPCAQEARDKGYLYFGIQFYGECWSGPSAHASYTRDGISSSCVFGVGQGFANMVYRLVGEQRECEEYNTLDTIDRSALYTNRGLPLKCDNKVINGKDWYRFTGPAGYAMANHAVERNKCQTKMGGYFDKEYPNITEGIVKSRACFGQSCTHDEVIYVRNCGSFYVYKLTAIPGCPTRYCGNGKQSPPITFEI